MGVTSVEIKAAMRKSAAWGTAVPCGAGDGMLILPSIIRRETFVETDDFVGHYYPKDGDLGAIRVDGELSMCLRYDGCDLPLALAMGQQVSPPDRETPLPMPTHIGQPPTRTAALPHSSSI